ncbi:hypothetical protein CFIO01_08534 [Colletotrichum fioriniae PJ7]|uniref:Uncharacterized protein n=1 Tax=Colletotrichum fioriniae PJ7 TaxID=1445577 RepID=A0A010QK29_9PEZI|nr:hypothetical protein CFIO01_08534 [Colletotrichum fioriniae PJ7]
MQDSVTAEKKTKTKKDKNMSMASSKTTRRTLALTEQKHSCLRNNLPLNAVIRASDRMDGPVWQLESKSAFDIWQPEPEPLPAGDLYDVLPRKDAPGSRAREAQLCAYQTSGL